MSSYRQQPELSSTFPSPSASFSSSTGGISPSDPSPIMPTTPRSTLPSPHEATTGMSTLSVTYHERDRDVVVGRPPHSSSENRSAAHNDNSSAPNRPGKNQPSVIQGSESWRRDHDTGLPLRSGTSQPSSHPLRPW
ncbi:hypothetical protein BV25DRAFT_209420 [Artomyces pyxidatus]|uniref:Uncharacterized protein n=1 Tax=Artomyces pyxidatus TaxID=48021 RepID=A0ACB8T9U1_9AGAM|nr:hypothetical protein BV25DRAFT_209420 [Artomyces pyxidatus]